MLQLNQNYLKLPGHYLFSEISRKTAVWQQAHPDSPLIRLGIGDVTRPLTPAVISALHEAVDEQSASERFCGYGPEQGYSFLREAIAADYQTKYMVKIRPDEIFVSDGSKCDTGNIGELFAQDATVAVCDPVYPVYVDSNVMAGRAGEYLDNGRWSRLIYLPCTESNQFCPQIPDPAQPVPDLIYLCFPNNPTGAMADLDLLQQWVDYARKNGSLILYDAAYSAYIQDDLPRTIYAVDGARECAIEFCSFSKLAGFTGLRLGYTVIPQELKVSGTAVNPLWSRRQTTKFNGASCLSQKAGAAVFSPQGQKEIEANIRYYQQNASMLLAALQKMNFTVYGGVNAPYIWLKTPNGLSSWEFFDLLLDRAGVVGTPGSGFGPCGEGYFRLTAFGAAENTKMAIERIGQAFS